MIGNIARLLGAAAVITMAYVPFHGQTYAGSDKPFIAVGGQSLMPYGWADFCHRYVGECDGGRMTPMDVDFTPQAMKRIQQVNSFVNKTIKPMSDMEHWGVVDQWDYPSDGYGDCEDYVLLKRRILMDDGFPRQALLITVVKDQHGDGHAVLTVKTSVGEHRRPAQCTPHRFALIPSGERCERRAKARRIFLRRPFRAGELFNCGSCNFRQNLSNSGLGHRFFPVVWAHESANCAGWRCPPVEHSGD